MSDGSKIEWTDATWNVVIGCTKVSPGCDHCYAITTAHRFQGHPNPQVAAAYAGTEAGGEWTGRVNLVENRLVLPLAWKRPRRIFVNAQSDLFHAEVSDEFIARVWAVMALAPQHTFQVLTKRHGRMRSLLSNTVFESMVWRAANDLLDRGTRWPDAWEPTGEIPDWPLPNVHLGVSVEDQARADLRIPALLDTPAAVRWLSCEPLLGPVSLGNWLIDFTTVHRVDEEIRADWRRSAPLEWVVVGGESGPGARPMHPEWARALRDQCAASGVPFLFKQWGEWVPEDQSPEDAIIPARFFHDAATDSIRLGKRAAGRVLDGRTWDQYPAEVTA